MSNTIGIIGSGNIGRALATHLSKTNYRVLISNSRGPESLQDLVASMGGSLTAASLKETIAQSDVLFLAIPWSHLAELAKEFAAYRGKIIVDATNNYVSFNPFKLADLGSKTTGEYVANLFPAQRIVKAFNTLAAATLAQSPKSSQGNTVIFISGNDTDAKKEVIHMAEIMGFAPIDLGTFQDGGKLQDAGGPFSGVELIKVKR